MIKKKMATYGSAAALMAAGLVTGGVLAGSLNANAATGSTSTGTVAAAASDPTQSGPACAHETLLTGDTAAKVKAAVLAKYPGATVMRLETDKGGVYEAHIVTAGKPLIVQVGKDFTVTGTQTMRPPPFGPPPAGAPTQSG